MAKKKTATAEGPILRIDKLTALINGAEQRIKSKKQTLIDNVMDQGKIERWQKELDELTGK